MSQSRYRVGGNAQNLSSASPAAAAAQGQRRSSNAFSGGSGSPTQSVRRSSLSPAGSGVRSQSPNGNSSMRKRKRSHDWSKEGTAVGKSLSFAPADLLAQRRMMCARRNEIGAEKIVCQGKGLLDSGTEWNGNNTMMLGAADDGYSSPQVAMNPVDAPSPLDRRRLQLSPLRSPAGYVPPSPKPPKADGDGDAEKKPQQPSLFDDDEEEEEELEPMYVDLDPENNDTEDGGFESVPYSLPLPDWRVLCNKELYKREADDMELIRDKYAVATNPQPEKKGRRRSSVVASANNSAAAPLAGSRRK